MERAGLKPGIYNFDAKQEHRQECPSQLGASLCYKKKGLAGSEAQCYTKGLYWSSNEFVKRKMWNGASLQEAHSHG